MSCEQHEVKAGDDGKLEKDKTDNGELEAEKGVVGE